MKKTALALFTLASLAACQTPPDIQQLQNRNTDLQSKLEAADNQILKLKSEGAQLNQSLAERDRVIGVLGQEKNSRVVTSTALRGQVRQYVQQQIDSLKGFLLDGNLLDYIGGELVERSAIDEKPLLVVDLANTVPVDGSLTSLGGYFNRPGTVYVKVLRKVEDDFVVVWASNALKIKTSGIQKVNFSVSVGAKKDDVVAYYLVDPGMVSFDAGTGNSRYLNADVSFGKAIAKSSLLGEKQRRSYSLGVYGLLDSN